MNTEDDEKDRRLAEKLFGRVVDKNGPMRPNDTPEVGYNPPDTAPEIHEQGRESPPTQADQPRERLSPERLEELAQLVVDVARALRDRAEYEKAGRKLN